MTAFATCMGGLHGPLTLLFSVEYTEPTKVVCEGCQRVWALTFLGSRDEATLMLNHVAVVAS